LKLIAHANMSKKEGNLSCSSICTFE